MAAGWFIAPKNFSKEAARQPLEDGDYQIYPAIFGPEQPMLGRRLVPMACIALSLDSKLWWVEITRTYIVQLPDEIVIDFWDKFTYHRRY